MANLYLHNLSLLLWCFFYFFLRGKANKKIDNPRKILIVQLAKMGDMVCTTPMFRAVKAKYPDSQLYVLGDRVNKELLEGNRDVDFYVTWDKSFFGTLRFLRKKGIEVGILTGPGPQMLALLYLSGIPLVIAPEMRRGFSPLNTRSYRFLTRFVETRAHQLGKYAPREYLRLLEPLGILSSDTKKHLAFSQEASQKVLRFLEENGIRPKGDFIVGISPGTGNKIKLWGRDKFAKVADWLYERVGAKIIITGSREDKKEIGEMMGLLNPKTKVINTLDMFSIDELKALISKLSLFISVDTGQIYIAEAFGVPTIDIVGPVDEKDQPPVGKIHKVVVAPRERPQMGVFNARVYEEVEARRQSEDITPEMVIEKINELFPTL